MGSVDGFISVKRSLPETLEPVERVHGYKEFYKPFSEESTKKQASRCMDCGVPFCHKGCPLGNLIPDFNDAVYQGDWNLAAELLLATNNFPEFTGRICPAPCEGSCVLGINKPPVTIEHIEKTIIEKAFENGIIQPQKPDKRRKEKVAIIGSGPAGLAAADQLNKEGFQVTVFERDEKPGGLLRFGIPDFKLEKWVVERRIKLLEEEGINIQTNISIGEDVQVSEITEEFDAVLVAIGSTIPRDLNIQGRDLQGVHFAMDFLTQQNRRVSNLSFESQDISAKEKNVIVIGGGDTGSDCIGTSNRHGAKSITQFELLQQPPNTRTEWNPWPEWPLVLRTSSSHEEGCERQWSILTKEFVGENGKLTSVKTVDIEWTKEGKWAEIKGSEKTYPCDLVLLAIGFVHPQKTGLLEQLQVELDARGNIQTSNYQTSEEKIFAAGDANRGQSLVVWAISEGREAAREIAKYLDKDLEIVSKEVSKYLV